ncbi:TetR/AcrR family transcriptional regulator [Nocardia sp. NPDC127526]|uniref:TetR/AcrR family transcriptional regulator n=1 Tax=Nocardia sp. NPDC127526 TaxID=3345393 RepID=UPI0036299493
MPRVVSQEQRRRDIVDAVWKVAAAEGVPAVTFRRIGKELGGSSTLVTESFPTRSEMLDYAMSTRIAEWEERFRQVSVGGEESPIDMLRALLLENCPVDEEGRGVARIWLSDICGPWGEQAPNARGHIRGHIRWFREQVAVLADQLGGGRDSAELLVTLTYGINAAATEEPGAWPPQRIEAFVDDVIDRIRTRRPLI